MLIASKNVHPEHDVGILLHLIYKHILVRHFEKFIGPKIQSSVRRYQFYPDRLTIPESEKVGRLGTDFEIVPRYMRPAPPLIQSDT